MAGITKDVIEQVRFANDIVDVVGSYIQLKQAGGTFKALCPFHKEKTPSFTVNQQRQIYHCFGCGAGGDVFKFVMEYEKVDFSTSLRMLAERGGIRVTYSDAPDKKTDKDALYAIHTDAASFYHKTLLEHPDADIARQYLQQRQLDDTAIREFLIGYAPNKWDCMETLARTKKYTKEQMVTAGMLQEKTETKRTYDRFRNRLMFPIRDTLGRVIAFSGRILDENDPGGKYVNSPETPLFHKSSVLYGIDKAYRPMVDAHTAIVCEGQIDCIRCHLAGIPNVVASQGTALTENHARLLKRYVDTVILVLDADKAGKKAALKAAQVLLPAGLTVKAAILPADQDPDSLILRQGVNTFRSVVDQARSIIDFQVHILSEAFDRSDEAGALRISRSVLEMVNLVPSATHKEHMLKQASTLLNISETALTQDLKRLRSPSHQPTETPPPPSTSDTPCPKEEEGLAEFLTKHPDLIEFTKRYLSSTHISHGSCRTLIEILFDHCDGTSDFNPTPHIPIENESCQRLAARIMSSPRHIDQDDMPPERVAQDYILTIWRKRLEKQRKELLRRHETTPSDQKDDISMEIRQLTKDISDIKHGWDHALMIMEH